MICSACRDQFHWKCVDAAPGTTSNYDGKRFVVPVREDRLSRSCNCQHTPIVKPEPATGAAGE